MANKLSYVVIMIMKVTVAVAVTVTVTIDRDRDSDSDKIIIENGKQDIRLLNPFCCLS